MYEGNWLIFEKYVIGHKELHVRRITSTSYEPVGDWLRGCIGDVA
jgi:hypothetical protein